MEVQATTRTFDTDLENLYSMMDEAWGHDYQREPRLDYTTDFLRWNFDAPTTDRDLLVGAYRGDEIVGFGSSFHRSMVLRGEPLRATLSTFFTSHAHYRRQGIGRQLVEERLRRNRERGYQCTFVYLQDGHASLPLYERYGKETGIGVHLVNRSAIRVRILDPSKLSRRSQVDWSSVEAAIPEVGDYEGVVREYRESDLTRCRELLNGISSSVPLARVWDSGEELAWQLDHPPFSSTLVLEAAGRIEGLVNLFIMRRIAKTVEKVAMFDNCCFEGLDNTQRSALIAASLERSKEAGCIVANLMGPPTMEGEIFGSMGFLEYPTYLNLYAVILDPSLNLEGLDRVYLDER